MVIPSGLESQLGISLETVFGTFVAPTEFLEFNSETLAKTIERIESAGVGRSTSLLRSDNWEPGKIEAGGTVELDVKTKGFNIILEQMFGASSIAQVGGGAVTYDHTHTIADLMGTMATWQIGKVDTNGTIRPFSYIGCKVTEWELSNSIDEFLKLALTIDAKNETTSEALASSSYATGTQNLPFTGATITIGGSSYTIQNISIKGVNGTETDRYGIGSDTKTEPVQEALREVTVEFELEFKDLTAYNLFINGAEAEIVARWQANTAIEDSLFPFLRVTLPACRFDGDTPQVDGTSRQMHTLRAKALNDGTNEPISVVYRTVDTTTYPSFSPSVSPSVSTSLSPSLSLSKSPSSSDSVSTSLSPSLSPSPS